MKTPTEAQAAAWLRTVIAPLLHGLDRALERLEKRDWTYRPSTRELHRIVPAAAMVPSSFRPNLAQMIRQGDRLRAGIAAFDAARDDLVTAARAAHDTLVASPRCAALEHRDVLAAYVVNNQRQIPRYFERFDEWQLVGEELWALRDHRFELVDRCGAAVEARADQLLTLVVALRDALADRYGLPAVEAPAE